MNNFSIIVAYRYIALLIAALFILLISLGTATPGVQGEAYSQSLSGRAPAVYDPLGFGIEQTEGKTGQSAFPPHPSASPPGSLAPDRAVLVALYNATDGDNWTNNGNWLTDALLSEWHGVTIGVTPEGYFRVTGLSLSNNGLAGEIPQELANLTYLTTLRLSGNQLTGCLPADWQSVNSFYSPHNDLADTGLPFCETSAPEATDTAVQERETSTPQSAGSASKMYWTDTRGDKIQRANLDGSQVEDLVTGLSFPDGIALDVAAGKMYWANPSDSKIQRANMDGSQVEDLVTRGLGIPNGIALDVAAGKMYWTDPISQFYGGRIQRANMDGSQVEDLVTSGLRFPHELELDAAEGKMYWAEPGTEKIQRANLDGSQVEDLVTRGLSAPHGLALDLAAGKMYWTDRDTRKIQRANLDGSQVENLVTSGLYSPYGIALDVSAGKMYWVDSPGSSFLGCRASARRGEIQRANLDGSQVEDLVTRLGCPHGIALDVAAGPPLQGSVDTDREALVALYNATGGDNWLNNSNWLTSAPLGDWYGVTTAGNGRVTKVELDSNSLSGTIPAELGSLHNLSSLFLSSNQLTGTIPAELGNLRKLQFLFLAGNQLTGCIPYSLQGVQYNDLALLGLDFCDITPADDPCVDDLGTLTADAELTGSWASGCDSATKEGRYARFYSFTLSLGEGVRIDLTSGQDTVLNLLEGAGRNGVVIANNDDADSSTTSSRIIRNLPPGSYTIEATTFDAATTGNFNLAIDLSASTAGGPTLPPASDNCVEELGLLTATIVQNGTWAFGCFATDEPNTYARFYSFILWQPTEVTIDLESTHDTMLSLWLGTGGNAEVIEINDDAERGATNSRIIRTLLPGAYTVEATTYSQGETGSFTLTVSGAGGAGGPAPGGCAVADIAADGSPVAGSWGADCESTARTGSYARYYQFTLTQSADVTVELESPDAETVLYLRDGAAATSGAHIGFNDGLPTNYRRAVIEEKNLAAGTYTVEATTYAAGETGSFTLTVSGAGGAGGPAPGGCAVADIAADGSPVAGSWGADCESTARTGSYARYYQFTLTQSADVTVELESPDAETVLYLRDGAAATSGAHIGFNDGLPTNYRRAVIEEKNLAAGTYTVEATTYAAGETGSFTLTVSGAGGAGGPDPGGCAVADIAADGSPVAGSWGADCESTARTGSYARYYQFTLTQSADVTVELESPDAETVLYLRDGAAATSGAHIGFNDGLPTNYRRAVIEEKNLAAGTYTVEATTYAAGETGSFTLTVSGAGGAGGPDPGGCAVADIAADGSPVAGSWGADCESTARTGSYARYYQFTLTQSADVTVELESPDAETVLYLRDGAAATSGAHIGFNDGLPTNYRRAVVEEKNLAAGTYTVEATTYAAGETGSFTLTVSGAGGAGGPDPGGCAVADIAADGSPVAGSWGADCESTARTGSYARYYQFTLTQSADVTVELESPDAETVLYLRDGAAATSGAHIGFNDGLPTNYRRAVVEEKNLAAGTYTVEATTYAAGETGSFTLTVSGAGGAGGPDPGGCAVADIAADGSPVAGSWGADCESTARTGSYARYYQFTLTQSADITVELESDDAETVLYLREGAGATSGGHVAHNEGDPNDYHRASIEETLTSGTYTIEATTYAAGETGAFTLTVMEQVKLSPQRAALMALYDATDGENWLNNLNWGDASKSLSEWYGVTIDNQGQVHRPRPRQQLVAWGDTCGVGRLGRLGIAEPTEELDNWDDTGRVVERSRQTHIPCPEKAEPRRQPVDRTNTAGLGQPTPDRIVPLR